MSLPEAGGVQIPDAVLASLEQAINGYLGLDPEGASELSSIAGKIIGIEIRGLGTRITVIPGDGRLQLFGSYAAEPDCLIRATPLGLARMGRAERKETLLTTGEVEIGGNTAIAHVFSNALRRVDVDWEEQLSRLVGDPIAHQIGGSVRAAARWGRGTSETLAADLSEYLQEEARLLPTRYEIDAFLSDVDGLRDDVERMAARVERLVKRTAGTSGKP